MPAEDLTSEITFKRWTINNKADMDECSANILDRAKELRLPFTTNVYGKLAQDPGTKVVYLDPETGEPVELWTLQVSDGSGKGGGEIGIGPDQVEKVVVNHGSLLMVLTLDEAAARGYGQAE